MHQLFFLFISFSFGDQALLENFSYADRANCSEKRLDKSPGVMSKLPVYDQNNLLMCWSYGAASLIDAWRIKNDPPVTDLISPLDLGLKYASLVNKPDLNKPDSVISVLEKANQFKVCTYKAVGDYMDKQKNAAVISELANNFINARKNGTDISAVTESINQCLLRAGISERISTANLQEYLKNQNTIKFLDRVFAETCQKNSIDLSKIPKPTVITTSQFGNAATGIEKMRAVIDQKLNEPNPSPVGISLCQAALKTKDVLALDSKGRLDPSKCKIDGKPINLHAGTIVGRRTAILKDEYGKPMKDRQGNDVTMCQYLVRDSYGTSCNEYPDEPRLEPKDRCVQGQIWVDEDTLFTNTSEAFYLKDK